jgi:hypothetical protein
MLKTMRFFCRHAGITLLALCAATPSAVFTLDLPLREIADDSALRVKLFDSWFTETPYRVMAKPEIGRAHV